MLKTSMKCTFCQILASFINYQRYNDFMFITYYKKLFKSNSHMFSNDFIIWFDIGNEGFTIF